MDDQPYINKANRLKVTKVNYTCQEVPQKPLPPFDAEQRTRSLLMLGIGVTFLLSACGLFISIMTLAKKHDFLTGKNAIFGSDSTKETAALLLNICVTICTEILGGYIHSVSLRWALYHEGRLQFNSNLRLFTSAKRCAANAWYTNALWILLVTVSYSSASQVLLPTEKGFSPSSEALVILCAATLFQCVLAVWCMVPSKSRRILSYNSSPLNTTLALLHHGLIRPNTHEKAAPRRRQMPAKEATKAVKWIIRFFWVLTLVIILWGVVILIIWPRDNYGPPNTSFDLHNMREGFSPSQYSKSYRVYDTLFGLGIITCLQLVYTLALHMAEQAVNLSRDEAVWRRASDLSAGSKGAPISQNSFRAMLATWQGPALLVIKPLSHWLFGISMFTQKNGHVVFRAAAILCLAGASVVFASLVTFLGLREPKGPQPAAWGNILKLAGFIDDWGTVGHGGLLFWGDKGVADSTSVRIAGTSESKSKVSKIKMAGVLYIGVGDGSG